MPKLVIVLEGGVVQGVCSDDPIALKDLDIQVWDYDVDRMEKGAHMIEQSDGSFERAWVHDQGIEQLTTGAVLTSKEYDVQFEEAE